ncbi:MAG: hypothetical protein ACLPXM_02780 [Terriglobales bacterium]
MFGVNWSDPQTLWLNVINLSLGIVTVVCIVALGYGVLQDVRARVRKKASQRSLEAAMSGLMRGFDGHSFDLPGLGLTMADGGEPVDHPGDTPEAPRNPKGC